MGTKKINGSICWDCHRATEGSCSWSRRFKPVDGWIAEERKYAGTRTTPASITYLVIACPMFLRDSYGCGIARPGTKEAEKFELAL